MYRRRVKSFHYLIMSRYKIRTLQSKSHSMYLFGYAKGQNFSKIMKIHYVFAKTDL